jgi:hypothetical protein|tara:strand:- start:2123 stop:2494 length:372 start_codon:yes stop_codon:yes gene_type:complete
MKLRSLGAAAIAAVSLCACANTGADYAPIVDGLKDITYTQDLAECRVLAKQRSYTNGDVKSDALLGAGIGAVAGGVDEGVEGAIGGLILGGLIGGSGRAWETQDERKEVVVECLKLRGHRVVG